MHRTDAAAESLSVLGGASTHAQPNARAVHAVVHRSQASRPAAASARVAGVVAREGIRFEDHHRHGLTHVQRPLVGTE